RFVTRNASPPLRGISLTASHNLTHTQKITRIRSVIEYHLISILHGKTKLPVPEAVRIFSGDSG
ncbi:MAG TPA: hypothetical protein PLO74_07370, partial [Thermotogota bacterium]|nr:hypothetical protein [Thermotogota bacterium]